MIPCDICGKEFKFPYLLLRHLNGVYSCSLNKFSIENGKVVRKTIENCQDVQENNQNVQENCQDVQEKVDNKSKKFQCEECEKTFTTNQSLKYHSKICNGVHVLQCLCFKTFASKYGKNKHKTHVKCSPPEETYDNEEKKIQCERCEKVLKTKQGMKNHSKICKGVHILQCPTCLKSFADRRSKSHHIKNVKCSPPEDTSEPHKNSVYLLIEREFMITKENIFKIGRSVKVCNRARQYPKGSQLLVVLPCIDSVVTECNLKRVFSEKFIQRSDIGAEYYEGPPNAMIKEFVANVALHF